MCLNEDKSDDEDLQTKSDKRNHEKEEKKVTKAIEMHTGWHGSRTWLKIRVKQSALGLKSERNKAHLA
jgi:hypothetical protein